MRAPQEGRRIFSFYLGSHSLSGHSLSGHSLCARSLCAHSLHGSGTLQVANRAPPDHPPPRERLPALFCRSRTRPPTLTASSVHSLFFIPSLLTPSTPTPSTVGPGTLQVANKAAHSLFGYSGNELKLRNINVLMPPPFAEHHNAYVRGYISSNREVVIGRRVEQLGLHKVGFVVCVVCVCVCVCVCTSICEGG